MSATDHATLIDDEHDPLPSSEPSTSRPTQYSFTPENNKTSTKPDEQNDDDEKRDDSMYVCNICLDIAKSAVVSLCGHLYCWPCLNTWIETRPQRQVRR